MTIINVRTLADARDGSRLLDATITATATRARVDGRALTLPEPVTVRLKRGELSTPLVLDAPDGTWAWLFRVRPTGARLMDALTLLATFAGDEVDWADLTPVDPATLVPLDPVPPSALEVLVQAGTARDAAETAADRSAAAQASSAAQASAAQGYARDAEETVEALQGLVPGFVLTQDQYDDRKDAGTLLPSALYIVTD